ncbi:hypothetical protein, partial [Escherichia coli]|uniref:hypothetical protein n=1 Tax=Escherichia coli TaxID=562 RepID=UPI00195436B2
TYHNWQARILPGQSNDDITHMSSVASREEFSCFGTYDAKIEVAAINFRRASSLAQLFFGRRDYVVIDVNLTNT